MLDGQLVEEDILLLERRARIDKLEGRHSKRQVPKGDQPQGRICNQGLHRSATAASSTVLCFDPPSEKAHKDDHHSWQHNF